MIMQQASLLLLALLASSSLTHQATAQLPGQANATEGEVAFAAPPAPEGGADSAQPAACANPCYIVGDRWPYRNCKAECDPNVCNRGERKALLPPCIASIVSIVSKHSHAPRLPSPAFIHRHGVMMTPTVGHHFRRLAFALHFYTPQRLCALHLL
jgi:hypothetical protein